MSYWKEFEVDIYRPRDEEIYGEGNVTPLAVLISIDLERVESYRANPDEDGELTRTALTFKSSDATVVNTPYENFKEIMDKCKRERLF